MKIAVQDDDGNLLLYTNPERFTETWENGKCRISAEMKADENGIVVFSDSKAKSKTLENYFEVPPQPVTLTESQVEDIGLDAVTYFKPGGTWKDWARAVFMSADFRIIEDRETEMTTADRVREFCSKCGINLLPWQVEFLANHLDVKERTEEGGVS